ncbi:hypothetical protein CB1_000243045 [Camelus ferus]|nr:hypothetical protein CB1_000243045 [Camelus ferus]
MVVADLPLQLVEQKAQSPASPPGHSWVPTLNLSPTQGAVKPLALQGPRQRARRTSHIQLFARLKSARLFLLLPEPRPLRPRGVRGLGEGSAHFRSARASWW